MEIIVKTKCIFKRLLRFLGINENLERDCKNINP